MSKVSNPHRAGNNEHSQRQPIFALCDRQPAGPLNYLTKFIEMHAVGLVPAFKPGEVWRLHVHHEAGCPLLADIPSCLCNPDLTFERFAVGGSGPCAMAAEHHEREAAK